MQDTAI